ncbi:MAG: DNA polymerase III subunit epsilon [Actinobacteria bacterium]|nr:DNA polymerase III subunit epsilon [Actinomycetota bacterium]MTA70840.1 DNA polymerase III subunit epsilon [Actinomycetota bacterium]
MNQYLHQTTFVVLDIETTGASPKVGAGITEIGAVKVRGGEVIGIFESFINPGESIPTYITALTGITDEMVLGAPPIEMVLPSLLEFLGHEDETVVVAHNAPFDLGFLKAAAQTHEYSWPKYQVLDTVKLARHLLTRDEVYDCKLSTLAQFFETPIQPTHRALDDAHSTVAVLHGLFERLGSFEVDTVEKLFNFLSDKRKKLREKIPKEF